MRRRRIILFSLCFVAMLLGANPAFAEGGLSFGLRPADTSIGYFEYTLEPGESITDAVLAINATEENLRLNVSVAAGHTALTGGITFQGPVDGPASWVEFPNEGIIEVPGGKQMELPFQVNVPDGTAPGEYVTGFIVSEADPRNTVDENATMGVQVIPKMGLTMVITIPGTQRCEIAINSITNDLLNDQWKVNVNLLNRGNVHFRGEGELAILPAASEKIIMQQSFEIGYYVPGDALAYPLYFTGPPIAGDYIAYVMLQGTDCPFSTEYMQDFSITPGDAAVAQQEAEKWALAKAASYEAAANELAQAEKLHSMGMILLGLAAILLIVLLILLLITSRKRAAQPLENDMRPPRQ